MLNQDVLCNKPNNRFNFIEAEWRIYIYAIKQSHHRFRWWLVAFYDALTSSESMLACLLDSWQHSLVKFQLKRNNLLTRKWLCECHLPMCSYFVSALVCLTQNHSIIKSSNECYLGNNPLDGGIYTLNGYLSDTLIFEHGRHVERNCS